MFVAYIQRYKRLAATSYVMNDDVFLQHTDKHHSLFAMSLDICTPRTRQLEDYAYQALPQYIIIINIINITMHYHYYYD
jgi:hypothetical protein